MYEVTIEVSFDAAHRLMHYEGKCRFVHGHSFSAIVCLERQQLDDSGFVIDFTYIKRLVKKWIDANWDHATILNVGDDDLARALGQRVFMIGSDPTAERLAKILFDVVEKMCSIEVLKIKEVDGMGYPKELVSELVANPIVVKYVSIKETPTSVATYRKE